MNKLKSYAASKRGRDTLLCFGIVIIAYIIVQAAIAGGGISSQIKGLLVPICAYVVMAISLNLTVGILGELSLGHAGFMSVGAFAGIVTTTCLADAIPLAPLRLAVAMVVAGLFAAIAGVIVGVPVLRLKGDYLAIVTLAFGEIIKNIVNVMYLGLDDAGLHFSLVNQNFQLGDHQRPDRRIRRHQDLHLHLGRCAHPRYAVLRAELCKQPHGTCCHGGPRQQDRR